jgi:hypothetical protein
LADWRGRTRCLAIRASGLEMRYGQRPPRWASRSPQQQRDAPLPIPAIPAILKEAVFVLRNFTKSSWLLYVLGDMLGFKRHMEGVANRPMSASYARGAL